MSDEKKETQYDNLLVVVTIVCHHQADLASEDRQHLA